MPDGERRRSAPSLEKKLKEIKERIAKAYKGEGKVATESEMGGTAEAPSHSGGRKPLMKIISYDGAQSGALS